MCSGQGELLGQGECEGECRKQGKGGRASFWGRGWTWLVKGSADASGYYKCHLDTTMSRVKVGVHNSG